MPAFPGFSGFSRNSKTNYSAAFRGGIVRNARLITAQGSPLVATIDIRSADKFCVQGPSGRLATNTTIALTNIGDLTASSAECEYLQLSIEVAIGATAPVISITADGSATVVFDRTFAPTANETELLVIEIRAGIPGSAFSTPVARVYPGNGAAN